ncbi:MAG TPA: DUF4328 domain-containing protein [Pseudonocardia sp.]|jgi:hypothetical protein|nr:DUF4328 domain-containing protein [Pseudonocardia sp.]
MTCPRCGRAQPPDGDARPFCAHCGQFLIPTRWVASPPVDEQHPAGEPASRSGALDSGVYTGPPRYERTPEWGFPALPWQRTASDQGTPAISLTSQTQRQAGLLVPLLRGLVVLAVLSAGAEVWRYILLLFSRNEALSAGAVRASDALVQAAAWVTTAVSIGVGIYLLIWVLRVMTLAAEQAGVRPSRSRRFVILGFLIPGINVTVPGSVLTEIEHTALRRPPGQRPNPSGLLRVWWALWGANVVFGILAVIWVFLHGAQAQADSVELHALVNLLAAATAETTARVVGWLTMLICPPPARGREVVLRINQPVQTG